MGRKKQLKDSVQLAGVLDCDLPYVFCVRCETESEAHELKGFIGYALKLCGSKVRYEYYRISPFDDIVYLFHKHDELDLPEVVRFYRADTIVTGIYVELKKERVIHRTEEDFTELYDE